MNSIMLEAKKLIINRNIFFLRFVTLMLLPVLFFIIYIGDLNYLVIIVLLVWWLLFFVAFVRVFLLVCPKCGSMIFANGMLSFRLRKCKNCGLSLK